MRSIFKKGKRILASVLTVIMIATMMPTGAYAAVDLKSFTQGGSYNENLLKEMTSLYQGDEAKAKTALDTLYANGLIDEKGNMVIGDTFEIEGKEYTKEELRKLSDAANSETKVTISGTLMTWGDIKKMFTVLDAMKLIQECEDSDVRLTENHITAMKSFTNQLSSGKLSLNMDDLANDVKTMSSINATSAATVVKMYVTSAGAGKYTVRTGAAYTSDEIVKKYALNTKEGAYTFSANQVKTDAVNGNALFVPLNVDSQKGSFTGAQVGGTSGNIVETTQGTTNNITSRTYTLTLENAIDFDASLDINIRDGSYTKATIGKINGVDVTGAKKSGTLTIAAGETTGTFVVMTNIAEELLARKWNGANYYVLSVRSDMVKLGKGTDKPDKNSLSWSSPVNSNKSSKDNYATKEVYKPEITLVNPNTYNEEGTESGRPVFKWLYKSGPNTLFSSTKIPDIQFNNPDLTLKISSYRVEMDNYSNPSFNWKIYLNSSPTVGGTLLDSFDGTTNLNFLSSKTFTDLTKKDIEGKYLVQQLTVASGAPDVVRVLYKDSLEITAYDDMPTQIKPEISIPDGIFYPGDVIPITVDLGLYAKNIQPNTISDKNIKITVNGDVLGPVEGTDVIAQKRTFLYTVKPLDQLTLNVTKFECIYDEALNPVDKILTYDDASFAGYSNSGCKINSPDKKLTFMEDTNSDGKPDILNSKMTFGKQKDGSYKLYMPIFDDPIYYAWLAANATQDKSGEFYVKSMYGSTDGGKTKIPFYIDVDYKEFTYIDPLTGDTVRASEKPKGIYLEFTPDANLNDGNNYELGSLELFLDEKLASTVDYISTENTTSCINELGWYFSYINEPSILFDNATKDVAITYDYNKTWNSFVPADKLALGQHAIPQIFDYQIANAEEDMILSYKIKEGTKEYTYPTADNFTWSSTDETIASVATKKVNYDYNGKNIQKVVAVILPTGKAGNVAFKLTVGNGGGAHAYELTSATVEFKEGTEPYLSVPKLSQEVVTLQNEAAQIYFSTNITTLNAKEADDTDTETEVTLNVYPCDGKGVASGDAVYTTTEKATVTQPITNFMIQKNIMDTVSASGSFSYRAEVSAVDVVSGEKITAYALIKVTSAPIKVEIDSLKNNYVLDKEDQDISWKIKNISAVSTNKEWYYVITRKSDNEVIETNKFSDFEKETMSLSLDLNDKLKVSKDSLKEIYNISVYASNEPDIDGYAVDSLLLYVYNAEALDILVRKSKSAKVSEDGDAVTLDNTEFIKSLLSDTPGDPVLALEDHEISLEELRKDVNLSSIVSINYGDYVWGLLSDQIEWKVDKESTADTKLNYSQGGGYSDIEAGLTPSYLPTTNFMLTATKDGEFSMKATHAKTGMTSKVSGTVKTLKDKLYLFQANPAVETEINYYKNEKLVSLKTDKNGSIAIYEPDGIKSDVYFKSKIEGVTYLGTRYKADLLTEERNVALLQVYPVDNIRLNKASEVSLYLTTPSGTPLKNTDVTVRGGVYSKKKYAPKADLLRTPEGQVDTTPGYSNGLEDQIFTTDSNGVIKVYYDVTQFAEEGYMFNAEDEAYYVFELRFKTTDGKETYKPEIFEVRCAAVDNISKNCTKQISLLDHGNKEPNPFAKSKSEQLYEDKKLYESVDLNQEKPSVIGASEKFQEVVLTTRTYVWNEKVDTDEVTHQAVLRKAGSGYSAKIRDMQTKEELKGQKQLVWVYPFSSFPILDSTYTMNCENYGGTKKSNGKYDWTGAWLAGREEKSVETSFSKDDVQTQTWPMDFKISNTIGEEESVDSTALKDEAVESSVDQLDFDIDKLLGKIVPGGDMLKTGMAFFSGIATGGDYTIGLNMIPTADPTIYNIILSVGEQEEEEGDVKTDYSDGMNTEDVEEMLKEAGYPQDDDDDDDEEEEDEDSDIEFKFSGALICRATYNMKQDSWDILLTGGEVGAKVGIKKEYKQNFVIAFVPVTMSFAAEAHLKGSFGAQSQVIGGKEEFSTLTTIGIGASIEAFCGVGFDYSIIALKIGIFGNIGMDITQKILVKQNGSISQGQNLDIKGEVGIKLVAKLLVIKYEKVFASVGFGWNKSWNDYDKIVDYWSGKTVSGKKYTATTFASGQTLFTLESSGAEDRDYLNEYTRVWSSTAGKMAKANEGWFSALQTNAYPYADPTFSEDGEIIVYISDTDSTDVEETVVSWAKWNGNGYTDKGPIAKQAGAKKEDYGYGDSYLKVSGSDGKYFATWVQQTQESNLADVEGEADPQEEVSNADVTFMMKSTEIMVASFDASSETWNAERLTDNISPDMSPVIASNGNGKAIAFWRSTYSSNSENPLDFDVEDTLNYSRYDGSKWSDSAVAYTGSNGSVNGLEAALSDNEQGLVAYTVKTGDKEDSTDFETFYTYIAKDDTLETVRATSNNTVDENIQVGTVKNGEDETFILGWYTEDEKGKSDIQLLAIGADGTLDTTFPESISAVGDIKASNTFRFAIPKNGKLSDLAIAWVEKVKKESKDDNKEAETIDTLQAVKLCDYDGYSITASQQLAEVKDKGSIDYFDVYSDGDTVNAVVNMTDYSKVDMSQVGQINIKDIVDGKIKRDAYASEELYQAAWDAEYVIQVEEYPDKVLNIYAADGESKMVQASYTFKDGIAVTETKYDDQGVFPGVNLGVTYMVKNMGINPISHIRVLDEEGNEVKKEKLTSVLMPGASASVMAEYPIGTKISNIPFAVEGIIATKTEAEVSTDAIEGMIEINRPDIGIYSMEVLGEGAGKRDINVRLYNGSNIPLEGNDKTVAVGIYVDSKCTKPLNDGDGKQVTLEITPDDTDAMNLIDNGAYMYQLNIEVEDVLKALYGDGEQTEIPEGGITLYSKAALFNNYGKPEQAQLKEESKVNNEKSVTFRSLVEKAGGEELSFLNTTMTNNENDSFTIGMDVSNNTMAAKKVANLTVDLLDADGNIIASKETFDENKTQEENVLSFGKEETIFKEITFAANEIENADEVVSVNAQIYSDEVKVSFDLAGKAAKIDAQTLKMGDKATRPDTDPTNEDYEFEGWYEDSTFTQEFDFDEKIITKNTVVYSKWKNLAPVVIKQPQDIKADYNGTEKILSVTAECKEAMSYQWYKDGKAIAEATANTYKVKDVADSADYYCIISTTINGKQKTSRTDTAKVEINKRNLMITADSQSKRYDGQELTKSTYTCTEGTVAKGDSLAVDVEGAITDKGTTVNTITSAKVMREDVDVTGNYNLTTVNGTLRVTETLQEENIPLITGHPSDIKSTYDGKERILAATATCDYPMTYEWYKGDKKISNATERTHKVIDVADSGKYYCKVSAVIDDIVTTVDTEVAEVNIAKQPITVTADSANKVYDDKPLTKNTYSHTGNLVHGHELIATVTGSMTKPGVGANTVTVVKVMKVNTDMTANYDVKKVNGTLTIEKGTNYKVSYNKNTKSPVAGIRTDVKRYTYGDTVTLKVAASKDQFFLGWNTKADGSGTNYGVGSKMSMYSNVTLYAQWSKKYTSSKGLKYKVNGRKFTVTCTGATTKKAKKIKVPRKIKYKGVTYKVTKINKKAFSKKKK